MTTLATQLAIGEIADDDLAHALGEHVNSAQQDGEDVVYSRAPDKWAIRLRYSGDRLVGAEPGPDLTPDLLDRILERVRQLQAPQDYTVGRTILFSHVRVKGWCVVDNLLQVLPPPPNVPAAPFEIADHPFVAEFPFYNSSVPWVGSFRYARAADDLRLLLNAVLYPGVRSGAGRPVHRWTYVPGSTPDELRSEFLQEGYFAPGFVGQAQGFSTTEGVPALRFQPDPVYYSQLGIGANAELEIPESFPRLIRSLHALRPADRKRFLRAAFWYAQYHDSWHSSISLAYITLICAIETLVPNSSGGARCDACGRATGPGPTQRFQAFVEEMLPGMSDEDRPSARELYRVRSKLAHGGALLRLDVERAAHLHPATSNEYFLIHGAAHLTKVILVAWLAARVPADPRDGVAA